MSYPAVSCPKCNGEMVIGYVVDMAPGGGCVSLWAKGAPKKFWLPFCWFFSIKLPKATECTPIGTFRCQTCGYLESYARNEFAPE